MLLDHVHINLSCWCPCLLCAVAGVQLLWMKGRQFGHFFVLSGGTISFGYNELWMRYLSFSHQQHQSSSFTGRILVFSRYQNNLADFVVACFLDILIYLQCNLFLIKPAWNIWSVSDFTIVFWQPLDSVHGHNFQHNLCSHVKATCLDTRVA
jgi:hypothetical protein